MKNMIIVLVGLVMMAIGLAIVEIEVGGAIALVIAGGAITYYGFDFEAFQKWLDEE